MMAKKWSKRRLLVFAVGSNLVLWYGALYAIAWARLMLRI